MNSLAHKKIIVAMDGSDASRDGLKMALQMAPGLGCSVAAVTAIQTTLPGYRAAYFSFVDRHILSELRQFAAGIAVEAKKLAEDGGTRIETCILEGEKEIFEQIVDYLAKTPDTAFLVMGSCGHGVRDRLLLGSTTQRLIFEVGRRQMKTPVLVVP